MFGGALGSVVLTPSELVKCRLQILEAESSTRLDNIGPRQVYDVYDVFYDIMM